MKKRAGGRRPLLRIRQAPAAAARLPAAGGLSKLAPMPSDLRETVLALPMGQRRDLFMALAEGLPDDTLALAECARRARELRDGRVQPLSPTEFRARVETLRQGFRRAR